MREASLLNSLGSVELEQKSYDVALDHYRGALAIDEADVGERRPAVATSPGLARQQGSVRGSPADASPPGDARPASPGRRT